MIKLNKKMRILKLIFLWLLIGLVANSQNANLPTSYFHYAYDSTGNRVRREVIVIQHSPPAPNIHNKDSLGDYVVSGNSKVTKIENLDNTPGNDKHKSLIGERKITISPNPTKGDLKIEISNLNSDSKGMITITDMSGKVISIIKNAGSLIYVDLSSAARGSYVLKIVIDGMSKEWVVMKL
jgi:hypothetical protein